MLLLSQRAKQKPRRIRAPLTIKSCTAAGRRTVHLFLNAKGRPPEPHSHVILTYQGDAGIYPAQIITPEHGGPTQPILAEFNSPPPAILQDHLCQVSALQLPQACGPEVIGSATMRAPGRGQNGNKPHLGEVNIISQRAISSIYQYVSYYIYIRYIYNI